MAASAPRRCSRGLLLPLAAALALLLASPAAFVPFAAPRGAAARGGPTQAAVPTSSPGREQTEPPLPLPAAAFRGAVAAALAVVFGLLVGLAGAPLEVSAIAQGLQGIPPPDRPDAVSQAGRAGVRAARSEQAERERRVEAERLASAPAKEQRLARAQEKTEKALATTPIPM